MPYLLQCSYMPGDTFGVSACLALQPSMNIAFLIDQNLADDKSKTILDFYRECGLIQRVKQIDITQMGGQAKDVWRGFVEASEAKRKPDQVPWDGGYTASPTTRETRAEVVRRVLSYVLPLLRFGRRLLAVSGLVRDREGGGGISARF